MRNMTKTMAKKDKPKDINDVMKALNSKYKGAISLGTDISRGEKISTGSLNLDAVLEGGYVRGKIIECYGPESSGKSALGYSLLANATGTCGFVDLESSYERETAEMYGVDTSKLLVADPGYLEEGMEATIDMVDAGCEVIIFDSIAGLGTKTEMEGNMEDHSVGKKATRVGQLMRKIHRKANRSKCTLFFVNQIRDSMAMWGSPITTPGGHALKFQATYRMQVTKIEKIEMGTDKILKGHNMMMRMVKNKLGRPGTRFKIPLIYGDGISNEWEIMEMALANKVLEKSGTWVQFEGTSLAQGEWNTYTFLKDNPELLEQIKLKLQ